MEQPWDSWPKDLIQSGQAPPFPLFAALNEHAHVRDRVAETRTRATALLREALKDHDLSDAALLLAGGADEDWCLYDTDTSKDNFRQEAFFLYAFGINEPDCMGAIDLSNGESILFVPDLPKESERWNGALKTCDWFKERWSVSECAFTHEVHACLQKRGVKKLFLLHGVNTDSGSCTVTCVTKSNFPEIEQYKVDTKAAHPVLVQSRLHKTPKEIELLEAGCLVTSQAHVYTMRNLRPGMSERHAEALFRGWAAAHGGSRHVAYSCICGAGDHGATLHYGHAGAPNDGILGEHQKVVFDMGGEYNGYATDITCSYPVKGTFTYDQAAIHTAVHAAMMAVEKALKPGVVWGDMHRLAERVILEHLLKIGILKGSIEELVKHHLAGLFMPHGLGHLLGIAVHDVGGVTEEFPRYTEPGLKWLRLARPLEENMVLTNEPGIYFNQPWIEQELQKEEKSRHVNREVLARFLGTGGCRLEDVVLITKDGVRNLTVCPRSVADIERVMSR